MLTVAEHNSNMETMFGDSWKQEMVKRFDEAIDTLVEANVYREFRVVSMEAHTPVIEISKFTVPENLYTKNDQKEYDELHRSYMKKFGLSREEAVVRIELDNQS